MKVTIIAAVASNGVIGRGNALPWHIPDDLKRFKRLTEGHHVLMGRKTYESLPRRLKGRKEVVMSKTLDNGFKSLASTIRWIELTGEDELFIIGGAKIYEQAFKFADRLLITKVNLHPKGDAFFPKINSNEWIVVDEEKRSQLYSFVEYRRNLQTHFKSIN